MRLSSMANGGMEGGEIEGERGMEKRKRKAPRREGEAPFEVSSSA